MRMGWMTKMRRRQKRTYDEGDLGERKMTHMGSEVAMRTQRSKPSIKRIFFIVGMRIYTSYWLLMKLYTCSDGG